jgi:hypothetical protein
VFLDDDSLGVIALQMTGFGRGLIERCRRKSTSRTLTLSLTQWLGCLSGLSPQTETDKSTLPTMEAYRHLNMQHKLASGSVVTHILRFIDVTFGFV